MPVEITWEGRTYVWVRCGTPKEGEYYIADIGTFCRAGSGYVFASHIPVFALKLRRQVFGGVVFEEMGEGCPNAGEWYMRDGKPVYAETGWANAYPLLRPVAIEGQP